MKCRSEIVFQRSILPKREGCHYRTATILTLRGLQPRFGEKSGLIASVFSPKRDRSDKKEFSGAFGKILIESLPKEKRSTSVAPLRLCRGERALRNDRIPVQTQHSL